MDAPPPKNSLTKTYLDAFRNLLVIAATGLCVYLLWKWNWIVAVILAIPAYILMLNVFGFLTLPLYLLTPESRFGRKLLKDLNRELEANKKGD